MAVTIYDIAKEAGVSASTVSRVLNNEPRISDATRKKVMSVVKKHNFHPSAAARGLVNQSTMIIGILVSDIRMPHHTEGAYIIENELAPLGYCCIIINAGDGDDSMEEAIKVLMKRRVDGVVMMGSAFQTDGVRSAIEKYLPGLPVVLANGWMDLPNTYSVLADERSGIAECVSLLVKKGRKNLAFVNLPVTASNEQKRRGFLAGIEAAGLKNCPIIDVLPGDDRVQGCRSTLELMEQHPEIDGIIYHNDLAAVGGLRALHELGIQVPQQVSVIGVDNSIYAEVCYPQLTSLDNKLVEMCTTCSFVLIHAIQGKTVAQKMLVCSEVVEREST